jgi:uncharacterized protein YecE (DUF72 family)
VPLIGTSGWQYADWRGRLYPAGLPQRRWLEHYAHQFPTVEVNSAFYRLPERSTFEGWAAQTPAGFTFAVKISRYLTHIRRLRDPAEPVNRFLERAGGLGDKLGPVLLQLPPNLRADAGLLDAALGCFPPGIRVVVEPRDASWWRPDVETVLGARGAALCWADRGGRSLGPLWRTADFGYLRMHAGRASPAPRYGVRSIDAWLGRLRPYESKEVYVYFNNDHGGAAVVDATLMTRRAGADAEKNASAGHG